MEDYGIPVGVTEGFIRSFTLEFLDRFGDNSLFVRAVSDLWTSALACMLEAKDPLRTPETVTLLADPVAVDIIRALVGTAALKDPLFQEPTGFVKVGAIEASFDATFGPGAFARWLVAFEAREFDVCETITRIPT